MLAWVFLAVAVGLIGVLIQMWMAFSALRRRLLQSQEHVKSKTKGHNLALEALRSDTEELESQAAEAAENLETLEQTVMQAKEKLSELEEREARLHPSRHRVEPDERERRP
jgi:predicted  nucleic acid-binding Zn-ribbon protein